MATDPKKKASTKPKTSAVTSHELTTKKGSKVGVSKSSVDNAKAKKGVFKSRGTYKGKVVKGKNGEVSGIKTNDGKFHRATNPAERKEVMKKLAYDKKLFSADDKKHKGVTKRFATAERKSKVSSK